MTSFVYGNNDALLDISSAHNIGVCTNAPRLFSHLQKEVLDFFIFYFLIKKNMIPTNKLWNKSVQYI